LKEDPTVLIRPAQEPDFDEILALNSAFVAKLSPLDQPALASLHELAVYFPVVEIDGEVAAFLVALTSGAHYDSLNYRWFDERYNDFVYIDRIVVAAKSQGKALGLMVYKDLEAFATKEGYQQLVCEYDIKPRNITSERFHRRYGFKEVGQLALAGKKSVSMQLYRLEG